MSLPSRRMPFVRARQPQNAELEYVRSQLRCNSYVESVQTLLLRSVAVDAGIHAIVISQSNAAGALMQSYRSLELYRERSRQLPVYIRMPHQLHGQAVSAAEESGQSEALNDGLRSA